MRWRVPQPLEHGGGRATVYGSAGSTIVDSGGRQIVRAGGVASGTTISGGVVEVMSGGSIGGSAITFASGGILQLDASQNFTGKIAGFATSDELDLHDIAFSLTTTATFLEAGNNTSGTLTVVGGGQHASLNLLGSYADEPVPSCIRSPWRHPRHRSANCRWWLDPAPRRSHLRRHRAGRGRRWCRRRRPVAAGDRRRCAPHAAGRKPAVSRSTCRRHSASIIMARYLPTDAAANGRHRATELGAAGFCEKPRGLLWAILLKTIGSRRPGRRRDPRRRALSRSNCGDRTERTSADKARGPGYGNENSISIRPSGAACQYRPTKLESKTSLMFYTTRRDTAIRN